jgi:hypothetical protein
MNGKDHPSPYQIEAMESAEAHCDCCGRLTRAIYGYIHNGQSTIAAYFVRWTVGDLVGHPPSIDIIYGLWGEGATANDRVLVSLAHVETEDGPSVTVLDAMDDPAAHRGLAGNILRRDDVVGKPLSTLVFGLVDAVYLQDARLFA